nr:unnamed protein product [Arabidopsis thaliana]
MRCASWMVMRSIGYFYSPSDPLKRLSYLAVIRFCLCLLSSSKSNKMLWSMMKKGSSLVLLMCRHLREWCVYRLPKAFGFTMLFLLKLEFKHLHEKAAEFDIGIYFEANGHGTILFSESFLSWLVSKQKDLTAKGQGGSEEHKAVSRLMAVSNLINQAVGDALSGVLLVEVILQHLGWSTEKWNELYKDLPSRQIKVEVPDRTAVVTTSEETEALRPMGIQDAINSEIKKYSRGRAFIRPSGTEDVVRVYAEASTQEDADSLANSVAQLVKSFLGSS